MAKQRGSSNKNKCRQKKDWKHNPNVRRATHKNDNGKVVVKGKHKD